VTSDRDAEIVRRVRAGHAAFNRGDFDGAIEFTHPDVEYIPAAGQPPIRGRDQLRAWMEPSAFDRQVIEPLEITVVGNKVLVRVHTEARGAGSGIEVEIDSWTVLTVDDALLLTKVESYFLHEEEEARRALAE
jgi:ketosteroid isomerase-like protein